MKLRVDPNKRSKALQYYHDNFEKLRDVNCMKAKKRYQKNKAKRLEVGAAWRKRNKQEHTKMQQNWKKRRFFYYKAIMVKNSKRGGSCSETIQQLARSLMFQWLKQRGRCALTGVKLDRTANVDHIVPVCKGGTNESSNLQWLTPMANQVKSSLTVEELVLMCGLILQTTRVGSLLPPHPLVAWPDTTKVFRGVTERKQAV
jgi:hypothetical protein